MRRDHRRARNRDSDEIQLRAAIDVLRRDPKDLSALQTCFDVYQDRNDRANAAQVIQVVTSIAAGDPRAYAYAAEMCWTAGRVDDAASSVLEALQTDPESARLHFIAGNVFSELNQLAAGEYHFRRALEHSPSAERWTCLGRNLMLQGRAVDAEHAYRRALDLDPNDVQTLAYLAQLMEAQNALEDASEVLDRAEVLKPNSVSLLRTKLLARQGRTSEALTLVNASSKLNGDALLVRGQLHQKLGNYTAAWADFVAGKRALLEEMGVAGYDADAVERFFASMQSAFDRASLCALPRADARADAPTPLFIVGAPRSGTTLLERILSNHSAIEAGGELPFVQQFREHLARLIPDRPFPSNLGVATTGEWRIAATLLRDYYLARRAELMTTDAACRYIVDKMPFNEVYLPLIRMAFPDCPIIHLLRHPLDTAVSMLEHKLNHGFFCAYSIESIGHHLSAVASLHTEYRAAFDTGERIVRYEDLVRTTEATLETVLRDLHLPFEDACLKVPERPKYAPTPSYARVNEAVSDSAVGRHRHYQPQLQDVLPNFSTVLAIGGYEPHWP